MIDRIFDDMVCDFCGTIGVDRCNPCESFRFKDSDRLGLDLRSQDEWWSCSTCSDLIDKEDRSSLVQRSYDLYVKKNRVLSEHQTQLLDHIKMCHDEFFEHRLPLS